MALLYKIIAADIWRDAVVRGRFAGASIDLHDGFIHLSAAQQVEETARRHFAGETGLSLVAFREQDLGSALKWERSWGGELFPHLYGPLLPSLQLWARPLPWSATAAAHIFPEGWRT